MYDHIRNKRDDASRNINGGQDRNKAIRMVWKLEKNARRKVATTNLGMETNAKDDQGKPMKQLESWYKKAMQAIIVQKKIQNTVNFIEQWKHHMSHVCSTNT